MVEITSVMYFMDWAHILDAWTELEIAFKYWLGIIHFFSIRNAIIEQLLVVQFIFTSYKGSVCTN